MSKQQSEKSRMKRTVPNAVQSLRLLQETVNLSHFFHGPFRPPLFFDYTFGLLAHFFYIFWVNCEVK